MSRYSESFGQRVNQLLKERGLNPYDVQRLSGGAISHQTVRNMKEGQAPYSDFIVTFAHAIGADPNELLVLAERELRVPVSVRQPVLAA